MLSLHACRVLGHCQCGGSYPHEGLLQLGHYMPRQAEDAFRAFLTPAIVVMALGLLVAMYMQLLCGGSRLRSGVRWFCQIVVTLGQDAIQHGRDFHSHCCTLPRAHAALLTLQWLGPTGHVSPSSGEQTLSFSPLLGSSGEIY